MAHGVYASIRYVAIESCMVAACTNLSK